MAMTPSSASAHTNKHPGKAETSLARQLVKKADGADANRHLVAFQRIADRNGGTRASGTPGYDASVEYVAGLLRRSGYRVTTPEFTYDERVAADGTLVVGTQTFTLGLLQESIAAPAGGVTAPMVVLPEDATPGCEAGDFAGGDYTGDIVVIRRGACNFIVKAQNAAAAGAIHVIISNTETGTDLLNGTLGEPATIPVGFVDFATGNTLVGLSGQTATADPSVEIRTMTSRNVIAQTRKGRTDNVVMAGAHLDSVEAGPGINDNGTGSAGLLEVALELGGRATVKNAVRFAWWGTEELGLVGSQAYVDSLSFEQQLDIALYLNFDMIGSPNAAYFVYDGDDSDAVGAGPGPYGSAQIEETLASFIEDRLGVPTQGTDFTGRSDYGGFIAVGIPAGGLFTGAEGIKTAEQAALWGGTAGIAYDPCYHAACDNLGNVDRRAFDRNIDAIAWSVGSYATSTREVNGTVSERRLVTLRKAGARSAPTPTLTGVRR
ncbi:M28 family metallopeptidase [Nocardioides sp. LHG3406-4]|uniref:M28 family metallopeptidase n=1 Tax=Nocardioides sp. LHG3406-4 TaxID=2804575 RepID=UPI003CEEC8DC